MAFIHNNPNPKNVRVGDCVIRAISIATAKTWEDVYTRLAAYGFTMCDMPSSNAVWGKYLKDQGYERHLVEDTCPDECYTIHQFCIDHPKGIYIVATDGHVVCVMNGDYYDTWDSGNEVPIYYWRV